MEEGQTRYQPFPEPRWSLAMRAGAEDPNAQKRALADLCQVYGPPVYAFIRSKGNPPYDAEDLAQGFFAEFLRREDFDKTDASKGRLRSYLLGAANKSELFEALRPSIMPGGDISKQAEIAAALGMSDSAVRVAIHRLRQRYGKLLKETVADTIGEGEDANAELRELMAAFS